MIPILLSILSYDIWFYISHLILHMPAFYVYHKQHHRAVRPTFIDTYDASHVENVLQGIGMFFPYVVLRYTVLDTVLILCILNVRGVLRHDEQGVALVGDHHLVHHREPSYNFGEPWIDTLCGTSRAAAARATTASHNVNYDLPHSTRPA